MKDHTPRVPKFALFIALLVHSHQVFPQVEKVTIETLADRATIIVYATVTSTRSQWIESQAGRNIVTFATMRTEQLIKGHIGSQFILEILGGTIGDTTQYVTHSIQLNQDEEGIFFLVGDPYRIIGGHQGKIPVTNNHVLYQSLEIPKDTFINKLTTYLKHPFNPIQFDTVQQKLKIDPKSPKKDESLMELPNQQPQPLKLDPTIPKKEEDAVEPSYQQPQQLKLHPNSPKKEEDAIDPPNQQPRQLKLVPSTPAIKDTTEKDSK